MPVLWSHFVQIMEGVRMSIISRSCLSKKVKNLVSDHTVLICVSKSLWKFDFCKILINSYFLVMVFRPHKLQARLQLAGQPNSDYVQIIGGMLNHCHHPFRDNQFVVLIFRSTKSKRHFCISHQKYFLDYRFFDLGHEVCVWSTLSGISLFLSYSFHIFKIYNRKPF